MDLFRWIERKLFLGEVIKDYGVISETSVRPGLTTSTLTTSVVLCRRHGRSRLAIRTIGKSTLRFDASYAFIDVTPQTVEKLIEVFRDSQAILSDQSTSSGSIG